MISSGQELEATRERIEQFQRWLGQMRRNERPEEFEAAAGGYRPESSGATLAPRALLSAPCHPTSVIRHLTYGSLLGAPCSLLAAPIFHEPAYSA